MKPKKKRMVVNIVIDQPKEIVQEVKDTLEKSFGHTSTFSCKKCGHTWKEKQSTMRKCPNCEIKPGFSGCYSSFIVAEDHSIMCPYIHGDWENIREICTCQETEKNYIKKTLKKFKREKVKEKERLLSLERPVLCRICGTYVEIDHNRSCWNCNNAHAHHAFRKGHYQCFSCGTFYCNGTIETLGNTKEWLCKDLMPDKKLTRQLENRGITYNKKTHKIELNEMGR